MGIEDSEREMEGFGTIGIASPPHGLLTCRFPSFGSLRWSLVLGLYCFIITLLLSLGWGFITDLQGGWLTRYWAVIWVYEIGWFDHLVCLFWPASLSCEVGCPICFPWICCLVCCLSRDEFVGRNLLYLVSHTPQAPPRQEAHLRSMNSSSLLRAVWWKDRGLDSFMTSLLSWSEEGIADCTA